MILVASHLFVRLLRTTNQFTCFCMMSYLTHGTQSNITNTTTATQMWTCWRKRKIAWDYEVQIHVGNHRHHTCREHHSAQLWCFLNKFWPSGFASPRARTIRILGASDQDQFPFSVHSLSPSLSGIVHIDFCYTHFLSWNILFNKLSGLTRFCYQPIFFFYLLQEMTHNSHHNALHEASAYECVLVGSNLSEIAMKEWRYCVTGLSHP